MPVAPPPTRRAHGPPDVRRVPLRVRTPEDTHGGDGGGRDGGDGDDSRPGLPLWLAVAAIVAVGTLLTALGMFSQILANLAGSQLPGA